MDLKFTITNESASVIDMANGGKNYSVRRGAPNFAGLVAALEAQDGKTARGYLTVKTTIETWAKGLFKMVGSKIVHGDDTLPDSLSIRIFDMISKGDDPQSLLNFWERLQNNPSWKSVNQLWGFLANQGIPIDQDGFILAYKGIKENWTDCHTGTIINTPGSIHEMPRNKISDDDNTPCHFGYHVGALDYAKSFAQGKVIICKVDPAHVVCIPKDAGQQKMRTCRYEVIGVYSGNRMSSTVEDTKNDPAVAAAKKNAKVIETQATEAKTKNTNARAEAGAAGKDVTAATQVKTPVSVGTHRFDTMESLELMEQNLGELRTYAATHLHIVGASKLPGGKVTLVARIEEVRG